MSPPAPDIAVVIPCFNDGATLGEAVASAREQDVRPQVVVVDDGSTDPETVAAFDAVAGEGVQVIHQENAGLSAARWTGARATSTPYLFPLDADDRLAPGALRVLRDALEAEPRAALAWGWYRRIGQASYLQKTPPALDPWQVTYQNDWVHSLIRRSALEQTDGWVLKGGYEDWDLWMSFAERGWKGVGVPVVTLEYRAHGTRMLSDSATRHAEIYDHLRRRHPDLFAARRRNWRSSAAPPALRLMLPAIEALPVSRNRKRQLGGLATHLAYRRGVRTLVERLRTG